MPDNLESLRDGNAAMHKQRRGIAESRHDDRQIHFLDDRQADLRLIEQCLPFIGLEIIDRNAPSTITITTTAIHHCSRKFPVFEKYLRVPRERDAVLREYAAE